MQSIEQKARAYKRGTINQLKPFLVNGLVTASEIEFIASGAMIKFLEEVR